MPKPTVWPMVLSLGLGLVSLGIAIGALVFTALGGLLVVVSLWHWFAILVTGTGEEEEPISGPRPSPIEARPGMVERREPAGYRARLPEQIYPVKVGLWGGLAGGLVMPIPAEVWGLLSGHGLWFPVNLLAGIALPGVDDLSMHELEQFRPVLLVFGIVGHAVMSAIVGLIYGVLLPLMPGRLVWQWVFGGLVIPMVWTGLSGSVMGIANPVLREYVNWYWFATSQFVFGLAATAVVVRSQKVNVPPAGTGVGTEERGHS